MRAGDGLQQTFPQAALAGPLSFFLLLVWMWADSDMHACNLITECLDAEPAHKFLGDPLKITCECMETHLGYYTSYMYANMFSIIRSAEGQDSAECTTLWQTQACLCVMCETAL